MNDDHWLGIWLPDPQPVIEFPAVEQEPTCPCGGIQ